MSSQNLSSVLPHANMRRHLVPVVDSGNGHEDTLVHSNTDLSLSLTYISKEF